MLWRARKSLVKALEPSSCAAAWLSSRDSHEGVVVVSPTPLLDTELRRFGLPTTGFVEGAQPNGDLKGLRIAWRPLLGNAVIDSEVLERCEAAAMTLGELGASVEPMDDDMEPTAPFASLSRPAEVPAATRLLDEKRAR